MHDSKFVTLPLTSHFRLQMYQCLIDGTDIKCTEKVLYANAVGSYMYNMTCTRLDIAHAISNLSRFMANLDPEHWTTMKWLIRYLKGFSNLGLCFKACKEGTVLRVL